MGGGDKLTMNISKTQGYVVASRPVLLNQGLGLLMFSHAGLDGSSVHLTIGGSLRARESYTSVPPLSIVSNIMIVLG